MSFTRSARQPRVRRRDELKCAGLWAKFGVRRRLRCGVGHREAIWPDRSTNLLPSHYASDQKRRFLAVAAGPLDRDPFASARRCVDDWCGAFGFSSVQDMRNRGHGCGVCFAPDPVD